MQPGWLSRTSCEELSRLDRCQVPARPAEIVEGVPTKYVVNICIEDVGRVDLVAVG